MIKITGWTTNALQQQSITLSDGSVVTTTIYYREQQQGWFITALTWQTFVVNGLRVTNNIDMLLQWKNLIPFGLACVTAGNYEPSQIQDFASGASVLYILEAADMQNLDALFASGS